MFGVQYFETESSFAFSVLWERGKETSLFVGGLPWPLPRRGKKESKAAEPSGNFVVLNM